MKCIVCGSEIPDGAKFCMICGASQEVQEETEQPNVFCPKCGNSCRPDAAFCKACGASLRRTEGTERKEKAPGISEPAHYVEKARKKRRSGRTIAAVLIIIGIGALAAGSAFAGYKLWNRGSAEDYIAYVTNEGTIETVDVTKDEKEAVSYSGTGILDIEYMDWWENWNIRMAGREEDIEQLLGEVSTTQISGNGKYLCYASNYHGTRSYRLEAQRIGKPKKEPVEISDDVVMHRVVGKDKVVFLKGSNNTLYISNFKGKKEEIAENVAYLPFFVDETEENVVWFDANDEKMCTRNLNLKKEARKLDWESVKYISADLQSILGSQGGNLYIVDRFQEEKLLIEGDNVGITGMAGWYSSDFEGKADFLGAIGADSEFFCQVWDDAAEQSNIYHYKEGEIELAKKDASIVSAKDGLLIYRDNGVSRETSYEDEAVYLWADGKETELDGYGFGGVYFSEDGSKGWAVTNLDDGVGMLSEFDIEKADGVLKTLVEELSAILAVDDKNVYYTGRKIRDDDYMVNGELFCNETLVDTGGMMGFVGKDKNFYYRTGQDLVFTLKVFDGEETKVVADNVIEAKVMENGDVAVLACENYETENGYLTVYTEDGESYRVAEGVTDLKDADISIHGIEDYD